MKSVQPYRIFWVGALILLAVSFLIGRRESLDLHLYDTYFVVSVRALCYGFILLFLLFIRLYKAAGPLFRSALLNWFHMLVTLFTGLFVVFAAHFLNRSTPPVKYIDFSFWGQSPWQWYIGKASALLLLLFVVAQLAFLLNAASGLILMLRQPARTR